MDGDKPDGFVGDGGAHVGLLFFLGRIHVHVVPARTLADKHAFVHLDAGTDEQLSALLQIPERVTGSASWAVGDERARQAQGHVALPVRVAVEQRVHHDGAAGQLQRLAAQADQAPRGNGKIQPHATGAHRPVADHFGVDTFSRADFLHQ